MACWTDQHALLQVCTFPVVTRAAQLCLCLISTATLTLSLTHTQRDKHLGGKFNNPDKLFSQCETGYRPDFLLSTLLLLPFCLFFSLSLLFSISLPHYRSLSMVILFFFISIPLHHVFFLPFSSLTLSLSLFLSFLTHLSHSLSLSAPSTATSSISLSLHPSDLNLSPLPHQTADPLSFTNPPNPILLM